MVLKGIQRRDFLQGVALSTAALASAPLAAVQSRLSSSDGAWQYPPEKTGMRGAHAGSFEVTHGIAWNGDTFKPPRKHTDRPYDLIIVGGGISGLATALFARQRMGNKARILILDNHDDFGGHAKRNEFRVGDRTLIGYGGSQSIDTPSAYSKTAKKLLESLTVDTDRFYRHFDQSFFQRAGLGNGIHLDARTYGDDRLLVRKNSASWGGLFTAETEEDATDVKALINQLPLPDSDKSLLTRMLVNREHWIKSGDKTLNQYLRTTSFEACMRGAGMSDDGILLLRNQHQGYWGYGWDALSGMEAIRMGHPATYQYWDEVDDDDAGGREEPYIFHFPDGNAALARLAVAKLIPEAVEASDMYGLVKARVHYDRLDLPHNPVRIRLNSTVVEAKNADGNVYVTYKQDGRTKQVVGQYAVMACWNTVLPHIMPEMGDVQREAVSYAEKVPLSYINVAINSQKAFFEAGVGQVYAPHGLCANWSLDYPVSMGGYVFPKKPEDPALVHMVHCPVRPGLEPRDQHRKGRMDMYGLSFEDYERAIVSQLQGALGGHGFDAERDIAAITVNRWPHGYTYEYNELYDTPDWNSEKGPHIEGRKTIGNIAIANADASGRAFVDGAIDAAARAIDELL